MKITIVQPKIERLNIEENLIHIDTLLKENIAETDIILLPELFATGYVFTSKNEVLQVSETKDGNGKILSTMKKWSEKYNCAISGGFAEETEEGIYNSMAFIYKSKIIIYRKIHLFYKEKNFFLAGDIPFFVFEYKNVKMGMMVCFDWFFPESIRSLALQGAQIVLHSANLVLPYCQDAMITRSITNRVFIATANRIGCDEIPEEKQCFTGQSQIVAPGGKLLFRLDKNEEKVITIEINPEEALSKEINEKNDLFKDRRPEMYSL